MTREQIFMSAPLQPESSRAGAGEWIQGPVRFHDLDGLEELPAVGPEAAEEAGEASPPQMIDNERHSGVRVPVAPFIQEVAVHQVRDIVTDWMQRPIPHHERVNGRNAALRALFTRINTERQAAYNAYRYESVEGFSCSGNRGHTRHCDHHLRVPANHEVLPKQFWATGDPVVVALTLRAPDLIYLFMRVSGSRTAWVIVRALSGWNAPTKRREIDREISALRSMLAEWGLPDDRVPDLPVGAVEATAP